MYASILDIEQGIVNTLSKYDNVDNASTLYERLENLIKELLDCELFALSVENCSIYFQYYNEIHNCFRTVQARKIQGIVTSIIVTSA